MYVYIYIYLYIYIYTLDQCVLQLMITYNVDMTPEQYFAELCLDRVTWYCLHYNKRILISPN